MSEPISLYDAVVSFHTITCEKCGKESLLTTDDIIDALDVFYEDGWRNIDDSVYCKKCCKKKLKKK